MRPRRSSACLGIGQLAGRDALRSIPELDSDI
jgi:hypothetical protein